MDSFSFVFSLYGLLLGLALAEVLAGFGNTLQERHRIRVGWQTPLLGLLVALDLTSFWLVAWSLRNIVAVRYLTLLGGLVVCGTYYLVARLVFPKNFAEWPDFDVYYQRHKAFVLGGVALCNVVAIATQQAMGTHPLAHPIDRITAVLFYPELAAAALVRDKRVNIALLALLCLEYLVMPIVGSMVGQVHGM